MSGDVTSAVFTRRMGVTGRKEMALGSDSGDHGLVLLFTMCPWATHFPSLGSVASSVK